MEDGANNIYCCSAELRLVIYFLSFFIYFSVCVYMRERALLRMCVCVCAVLFVFYHFLKGSGGLTVLYILSLLDKFVYTSPSCLENMKR